jgi:phenylpropionate dioxygenase-like ring-hydroxylating dioxygenase large terminal subunit
LAAQQRRCSTALVPRSSAPAAEAQHSTGAAEKPAQFNWYKQWYPVRLVKELDPSAPHAVMLLGLRLVLWKEGNTWR